MVISPSTLTFKNFAWVRIRAQAIFAFLLVLSACGTTDSARIKESREAYLKDNFSGAETALYTPEVFKNSQNRLEHFLMLSSIAMSEGQYEKAVYYLNRSRDIANQVRSSSGTFEWFSTDYRSNPIEFSYIHSMLVMSYTLLAEAGETPAWSTPTLKDDHGNPIVPAQSFPARKFDAREIAELKSKSRSELLAWDTFLETLKNTYPTQKFYKEDLWARVLSSFIHGVSNDNTEKRTAEILVNDAKKVFEVEQVRYPSAQANSAEIQKLLARLKKHALTKDDNQTLFLLEAGVIGKYKIKRFQLGLSTLFKNIQDPNLRMAIERVGLQVLISEAPEFGLIALGGAVAGAVSGGGGEDDEFEGPPRFFSDAIDRSFGFEIQFPSMVLPPIDTRVKLTLSQAGRSALEFPLPILSPLQEMLSTEMKARESSEMFSKAVSIGAQYLAILIPAVIAYRSADRDGNIFKKLAVLAGYFIAKKAIDHAHAADLRSWNTLPALMAADLLEVPAGNYEVKVNIENQFGHDERALGVMNFNSQARPVLRGRVGDLPLLKHRQPDSSNPLH